jgi:hypothetical protein
MKNLVVALCLWLPLFVEALIISNRTHDNFHQKSVERLGNVSESKVLTSTAPKKSNCSPNDTASGSEVRKIAWMLGCSIDSQAFVLACKNAGAVIMPNHMETWSTVPDMAFKFCTFHNISLVFTFHPGATPPPYHDFYTLNTTTEDIVRSGARKIARIFGKPPDATLVDSSLWDVANWWKKDGSPRHWRIPHEEISHWSHDTIPAFMKFIEKVVPGGRVAFRSPAPMFPSCVDPWWYACQGDQIVNEMHTSLMKSVNNVTRQLYGKYHFIDYYQIVLAKHKVLGGKLRNWYADTIHPGGEFASAYMSTFLDWVKKS